MTKTVEEQVDETSGMSEGLVKRLSVMGLLWAATVRISESIYHRVVIAGSADAALALIKKQGWELHEGGGPGHDIGRYLVLD